MLKNVYSVFVAFLYQQIVFVHDARVYVCMCAHTHRDA